MSLCRGSVSVCAFVVATWSASCTSSKDAVGGRNKMEFPNGVDKDDSNPRVAAAAHHEPITWTRREEPTRMPAHWAQHCWNAN